MTIIQFAEHMNGNSVDFVALDVRTNEAVVGNRVGSAPCKIRDHEANISYMNVTDVIQYFPQSWRTEWETINRQKSEAKYIRLRKIRQSYSSDKIMYASFDESIKVYIHPNLYRGDHMNISILGVQ